MDSISGDESYAELNGFLEHITQEALREKCCELALYLNAGVDVPLLVEEVEELARDAWALRVDDDN